MSLKMRIRDWVVRTVGGVNPDVGYKLLTEWVAEYAGGDIPTSVEKILSHYRSWIYVCASRNATAVASTPLRLYAAKGNGNEKLRRASKAVEKKRIVELKARAGLSKILGMAEGIEEITEHPLLDLLSQVNEWLNGYDAMELTQTYLEMVGTGYWYVRKNGLEIPEAFEVLPTQKVAVKRDKLGHPIRYILGDPPGQIEYDPAEIIHFGMVSPLTRLMGYGPGHAAFGAAARQSSIEKIEDALFENRAIPATVLVPKQPLTEAQSKQIIDSWNNRMKGVAKAGGVTVAPVPMEILKLAISAEELTKLADPKVVKEEIAAVFGIPLSKLELSKSDASAVQGDITYLRDTILPRLRRIEGKLNERLIPMYEQRPGVKMFLAFDNPLQADRQYELQRAQAMATTHGVVLINEAREAFGLESLTEVDGNFIEKPAGTFTNVPEVLPMRSIVKEKAQPEDRGLRTALRRIFREQRQEVLSVLAGKMIKASKEPLDKQKWNARIAIDTRPFIERDLAIGAALAIAILGVTPIPGVTPMPDAIPVPGAVPGAVPGVTPVPGVLPGAMPVPGAIPIPGAAPIPGALPSTIAWDIARPEIEEFVRNYVFRFAESVNDTTIAELREVFLAAEQEGMTASEIADGVGGVFENAERYRSMMIARTERSRAVHAGEEAVWRESHVVRGVRWLANPDACQFCKAIAAEYSGEHFAPLGGLFRGLGDIITGTDGGHMRLTYGDIPYPPLHPNCRCTTIAVLGEP